jgi:hypothetical protein
MMRWTYPTLGDAAGGRGEHCPPTEKGKGPVTGPF